MKRMGISLFLVWRQHSNILPPSLKATDGHSEAEELADLL